MSHPMPTPGPGTTWNWQNLPSPADLSHCRNTGRNLQRWGMRYGLRAGTSDDDKTRILAARMIHMTKPPATRPFVFDNQNNQLNTYALPCTIDEIQTNVFALIDDMQVVDTGSVLFSSFLNGGSTAALDWYVAHIYTGDAVSMSAFRPGQWVRAWLALNGGWGITSARLTKLRTAMANTDFEIIDQPGVAIALKPWELLGITAASYAAASEYDKWLCAPSSTFPLSGQYMNYKPAAWNHHRGPAHRRHPNTMAAL